MTISVITVSYNSSATIQNTFDSVRSQSFKNIEYIVIDGHSSDGTVDIIKSNSDIINFWISEKDRGLYDAINKGIQKATGDYIAILNSDDTFYSENTLAEMAAFIEYNGFPSAVLGDIVQHNGKKTIRRYSAAKWKPADLKNGFMPPHPAVFIKKEVYDRLGTYRMGYKIGADYELLIRFFLKNQLDYKYSGIITTSMLTGGASSSGLKSYNIITKEIGQAFADNGITYNRFRVHTRLFSKLLEFIN